MEESRIKEIIKLIEESEDEEIMSTIAERLAKELKNERKIGIAQAIKETIRNMILCNIEEEKIIKCTNTKKEEIEKIRKELIEKTNL